MAAYFTSHFSSISSVDVWFIQRGDVSDGVGVPASALMVYLAGVLLVFLPPRLLVCVTMWCCCCYWYCCRVSNSSCFMWCMCLVPLISMWNNFEWLLFVSINTATGEQSSLPRCRSQAQINWRELLVPRARARVCISYFSLCFLMYHFSSGDCGMNLVQLCVFLWFSTPVYMALHVIFFSYLWC